MFTEGFGTYVTDCDYIECEVDGFQCIARAIRDPDAESPDLEMDGYWPSLDPNDDGYMGPTATEQEWALAYSRAERVLLAWRADEWDWCGVVVGVMKAGVELTGVYDHALWRIERNYPDSDNSYLTQVANDLLPAALEAARASLPELIAELTAGQPVSQPPAVPDVWDRIKREATSGKRGA